MVIRHKTTNKILHQFPDAFPMRFYGANLANGYFADPLARPFLVGRWIDATLGSVSMFLLLLLAWMSIPSQAQVQPVVACIVLACVFFPAFCINLRMSILILKGSLVLLLLSVGGFEVFQESSLVPKIVWVLGLIAAITICQSFARGCVQGLDLKLADFSGCYLDGADFSGADLRGADFRGATLINVSFERANLEGAHFSE